MRLVSFLPAAWALLSREAEKNAAIDKVIQMLGDMEARGKKEKQDEEVAFAKFSTWCSDTKAEKESDIKASQLAITQFQARIEDAQATAAEAAEAISEAIDVQNTQKADLVAMKKTRTEENTSFIKERTDLQDSIYACEKASEVLSSVPEQVEAASFLQTSTFLKADNKHWATVQALLQTVQQAADPFTSASERRSDTVINMIEKLKGEFEEELQNKTKEESEREHHYQMNKQEAQQKIANNAKIQSEKEAEKADAEAAEGAAQKDLATEQAGMKEDKKYLAAITAECKSKASDFEARQKSRAEELTAIAKAMEIMSSPEAQTGAGHLDNAQSVGSFIQLKSKDAENSDRIVSFLKARANKLHSKVLMQLAEVAAADPFVKIRKMIQELVTRLEEEAKAEMTKKGKCDKDMTANKNKIAEFTAQVEKLSSEIESLESNVAELTNTKNRLTKEIKENKKNEAEAKKERSAEKAENEKVITESNAASKAIDQAMTVLQNYYSKVEGAFVQVQQPSFEGGEYKGMGGGGVLGLLEVIKDQVDQMVRETTESERKAASSHDGFLTESQVSLAKMSTEKQSTEQTLAQKKEDLADRKDALDGENGAKASLSSYVKEKNEVIDPVCIAKGVSFEERNAKREEEIQSLSEALEILSQMG